MEDINKTKEQLLEEISELRQRIIIQENDEKEGKKTKNQVFQLSKSQLVIMDSLQQAFYWKDVNQIYHGVQ